MKIIFTQIGLVVGGLLWLCTEPVSFVFCLIVYAVTMG